MILSVSRRTDIPAFYGDWFRNRLREGFLMVRNPRDPRQVSRIDVSRNAIDCIVFWTKDFAPMLSRLDELEEIPFYVQYTITPFDRTIEPGVPDSEERIATFQNLSRRIGPERVVWRYDPIFFANGFGLDEHKRRFDALANQLGPFTHRCVVSLFDRYRKAETRMAGLEAHAPGEDDARELLTHIAHYLGRWEVEVETCSEGMDFDACGVGHGKCIDDRTISQLLGRCVPAAKDSSQRAACGCIPSIDIGSYDTCPHGCVYCYANSNEGAVLKSRDAYDPDSPLLCDQLRPGDQVIERKAKSLFPAQGMLF